MNIKDQIKKAFNAEKRRGENGLVSSIWVFPFKMKSGAIISTQPFFVSYNELDTHNYLDMIGYRILFDEKINVQVKSGELIEYHDFNSEDYLLDLFEEHGGIDFEGTMKLKETQHALKGER